MPDADSSPVEAEDEGDDTERVNSRTIKADPASPALRSLRKMASREIGAAVEDYSDLAGGDDGDLLLQAKVANFKVSTISYAKCPH